MNFIIFLSLLLTVFGTVSVPYGSEPWLWYGNPVASAGQIVYSTNASARFTVLSSQMIRLEYCPGYGQCWEDGRTLAIWNRLTVPTPSFSVEVVGGNTLVIDTGSLLLQYTDDGSPFSASNLMVTRGSSAFWENGTKFWTPENGASVDPGQLFGTFHTLDNGLNGNPGLNCSLLNPNLEDPDATADFFPCDFGLISKSGWSLIDDSRSPVWNLSLGWVQTQDKATCPGVEQEQRSCFPGGFDTSDAAMCWAAGCCLAQTSVPLTLWYSASRLDYFTDNLNCGACGDLYSFVHAQLYVFSAPGEGLVPLNLYWNAAPGGVAAGAGGDNVASSFPPSPPGYGFARVEGYIYDPSAPQPPGTTPLKVYYSAARLDHYTTAGAEDEANATALGYTLLGLAGFALNEPGPPPPATVFNCSAPSGKLDWYILGHGADYPAAARDYVGIAGPVPIPRRHWMGISWSKWNESETQAGAMENVMALQSAGMPLDTLIFDMQWHLTPDWGGYSWDPSRYDNVTALLAWMHQQQLATGANLHDADGVQSSANPDTWAAFAAALGLPPTPGGGAPFDIGNKTYADALQSLILAPLVEQGLDMPWTDFQQGFPGVAGVRGLVPTFMLNHYRFHNASRQLGMRGTQHSRYAGRGDHRHVSSFGGDVNQSWESLAFMVYFTATAANAPLCWWGHEMMRSGGGIDDNSELFTRVLQFGAWSPTFTTWGNSGSNNNLWQMPEPYLSAVRGALIDRQRLLPYRYSAAAVAAQTGVCAHRSMYWNWPLEGEAYNAPAQYLIGDDILVAPISSPAAAPGANATISIWFPPNSTWIRWADPSQSFDGGDWQTIEASVYETPVFVRAGAILTLLPTNMSSITGISAQNYRALEWTIWPGGGGSGRREGGSGEEKKALLETANPSIISASDFSASTTTYEDDGVSTDYLLGTFALTNFTRATSSTSTCTTFSILTTGNYTGMIEDGREYSIVVLQSINAPSNVTQNGLPITRSYQDGQQGTFFQTAAGNTNVYLAPCNAREQQDILVC